MKHHSERKHSKYSASGAERWFACPGSVQLSEGIPSKDSVWSIEGTKAHEVLETYLRTILINWTSNVVFPPNVPKEMVHHAGNAAMGIVGLHLKYPGSEVLVETRIPLDFIHPEAFGTFDGAVVDHFGTLHVFDYKYGAGHAVSPKENLQMIFYGLGLAHQYEWNFKKVRLWIIQPRIKGYDGPTFWELSILELKAYVKKFTDAIERVEKFPQLYVEGSHCHWCNAKGICPLKQEAKNDKARAAFSAVPL